MFLSLIGTYYSLKNFAGIPYPQFLSSVIVIKSMSPMCFTVCCTLRSTSYPTDTLKEVEAHGLPPPPFPRGVLRQIDYIQELLSLLFLLARTAGGSKHNSMNCHKNMQISPERNAFSGCTAAAAKFPYSFPYRSFTFQRNPRAGLDHDKECVTYYPSVGCTLKKSMLRVTPPPNLYSKCLLLKHVQHERMAAFDARSLKT